MDRLKAILAEKLPEKAVDYCYDLWLAYPFELTLRKKRISKLGDYRYDARDRTHQVTVNSDLNTYQFLITYVHEVAHRVARSAKGRIKPHGVEWKQKFRDLMLPLLRSDIFPDDILRVLARHMKNPKASVAGDPKLARILLKYDVGASDQLTLMDISIGDEFSFRKRQFRKLETKRTRAVCLDLQNGKRYSIPQMAEVFALTPELS